MAQLAQGQGHTTADCDAVHLAVEVGCGQVHTASQLKGDGARDCHIAQIEIGTCHAHVALGHAGDDQVAVAGDGACAVELLELGSSQGQGCARRDAEGGNAGQVGQGIQGDLRHFGQGHANVQCACNVVVGQCEGLAVQTFQIEGGCVTSGHCEVGCADGSGLLHGHVQCAAVEQGDGRDVGDACLGQVNRVGGTHIITNGQADVARTGDAFNGARSGVFDGQVGCAFGTHEHQTVCRSGNGHRQRADDVRGVKAVNLGHQVASDGQAGVGRHDQGFDIGTHQALDDGIAATDVDGQGIG